MTTAKIDVGRFEDARGVEAGVVKEAFVFDGDQGMHERGRNIGKLYQAAALAVAGEIGDELGSEIEGGQLAPVRGGDVGDGVAREFDGDGTGGRGRVRARDHFHGMADY